MSTIVCLCPSLRGFFRFLPAFILIVCASVCSGCGSGSSQSGFGGPTAVTLLATGTANDQLAGFGINFKSITLTSRSGKTVNLLAANQYVEFIHLNGTFESLMTISVPDDVYTSVSVSTVSAGMSCVGQGPANALELNAANPYGFFSIVQVTASVPAPITVSGAAMGLLLNLQVPNLGNSQNTCYSTNAAGPSITANVSLSPVAFSGSGANSIKELGLSGEISSVNLQNNSLTATVADGQTLTLTAGNNTVYQGISGLAAIVPGMIANMDGQVGVDGSLQATRIAIEDADTTNLTASTGPITTVSEAIPVLNQNPQQEQGYFQGLGGFFPLSFGGASFQTAGMTNIQDLPFPAAFDASSAFAGQNVYVSTNATQILPEPTYIASTSVTLVPQTINGVVTGTSSEGNFTTYTISLAPYDLIAALAVQAGQTTVLTNPSNILVYVDSSTQVETTQPLAPGSVLRFRGLLFDDNGVARMDCEQINSGVAE
jgi:Domain of unknown function (DUF5666)